MPDSLKDQRAGSGTLRDMWESADEMLVTDLEDELVLMHAGRSEMFSLNDSGRLVWQALPASEETLATLLAETYGIEVSQARSDVLALLADLSARALVRRA